MDISEPEQPTPAPPQMFELGSGEAGDPLQVIQQQQRTIEVKVLFIYSHIKEFFSLL